MATKRTTARLEDYERRYRELARQLAEVGYIASGSVAPRYNQCGKPSCRCHADPPRLHGPYYQWTAKVNGKTVNRRLTEREATLYNEWIGNDRSVRALIAQMREVAGKAQQLMLEQTAREAG
ncbi:MAG TPA: DUF6788 family protein [Acidimicrobiales bacterium]|jgi:hypothetical protein|nr:DUF6788 family protein [Acidimicrobiales bacterium]